MRERSKWAQVPNAFSRAEEALAIRQEIAGSLCSLLLQNAGSGIPDDH